MHMTVDSTSHRRVICPTRSRGMCHAARITCARVTHGVTSLPLKYRSRNVPHPPCPQGGIGLDGSHEHYWRETFYIYIK